MLKIFHAYASKYYDPVKAHEYYMRTRELKGRSTTELNKEGKEVWKIAKSNIQEEKKEILAAEKVRHNQVMEDLRSNASDSRKRISDRLKERIAQITELAADRIKRESEEQKADLEGERSKTQTSIDRLMAEDYSNLSKEQRAQKIAERKEKLARLRGDLKETSADIREETQEDKSQIRTQSSSEKSQERDAASAEREKLSSDLKQSLESAREAYSAAKEQIRQGFEVTFNTEFDAIKAQYAAKPKSTKKKDSGESTDPRGNSGKSAAEKQKIRDDLYKERTSKTKSK